MYKFSLLKFTSLEHFWLRIFGNAFGKHVNDSDVSIESTMWLIKYVERGTYKMKYLACYLDGIYLFL
jgi:hypothetical protein